jgi:predicted DNA-binding protein YlxM (UPF0122 family)
MAISQDKWDKAKEYFEAGLSLTEIVDRTEISKSQISKKATKENWQKGNEKKQLISQAVEVAIKKETLKETALEVHNELVNDELRRKNLIFNATELLIKKATNIITKNQVIDKINVGDGVQNFEPRELNTTDLKNLSDTIDKASITLGVNQRHASSAVINNANVQQEVNNKMIVEFK